MINHVIWTEKYRPNKIEECILPTEIKEIFRGILQTKVIPNLLLYGSPGLGKSSVVKALCNELGYDYIVINGSLGAEESGIDAIRTKLRSFASSVSFTDSRKAVIIDEADYMNAQSSQPALRAMIEEFAENCSFLFTANYKERIIPAIQSRCSLIEFKIDKKDKLPVAKEFVKRIIKILDTEKIECENKKILVDFVMGFFSDNRPDFRKAINELQKFAGINGYIDEGLLHRISDITDFDELYRALKDKNYTAVRMWVVAALVEDPIRIYRKIYDSISPHVKPQSIPPIVVLLADYSYKSAFAVDQEINLLAFLTELMVSDLVEFV